MLSRVDDAPSCLEEALCGDWCPLLINFLPTRVGDKTKDWALHFLLLIETGIGNWSSPRMHGSQPKKHCERGVYPLVEELTVWPQ